MVLPFVSPTLKAESKSMIRGSPVWPRTAKGPGMRPASAGLFAVCAYPGLPRIMLFLSALRVGDTKGSTMALMDFIKKQFIDIIEWVEDSDGTLAWRYPIADREIQYGGSLTVRESQLAVFVNEGKVADVFGPGMHKLTTQTLPVLTYLKNWDKLFQSPFKSDIYFFSKRTAPKSLSRMVTGCVVPQRWSICWRVLKK